MPIQTSTRKIKSLTRHGWTTGESISISWQTPFNIRRCQHIGVVQEMKATRIAAIAILWATAPFYSRVPYGLNVALEGKAIASYGARYVLAGYMISATIASALLALVFFRWKWKHNAGFGGRGFFSVNLLK